MDSVKIKVQDKDYPVVFGYGVSAKLGRHWGLTGIFPLFKKAMGIMGINEEEAVSSSNVTSSAVEMAGENKAEATKEAPLLGGAGGGLDEIKLAESLLEFDNLELIGDIVMYGVANGLKVSIEELPFSRDQLMTSLLEDVTGTVQAYMAFIMTMPRPKSPAVAERSRSQSDKQNEKKRKPKTKAGR